MANDCSPPPYERADEQAEADSTDDEYVKPKYTVSDVRGNARHDVARLCEEIRADLSALGDELALLAGGLDEAAGAAVEDAFALDENDVATFEATVYDATIALEDAVRREDLDEPGSGAMFEAVAAASTIDAASESFEAEVTTAMNASWVRGRFGNAANRVRGWITNRLKPAIRKLSSQLWKLLSGLTNLQSWTLSGELGGSVPGLSGTVGLALDFGP